MDPAAVAVSRSQRQWMGRRGEAISIPRFFTPVAFCASSSSASLSPFASFSSAARDGSSTSSIPKVSLRIFCAIASTAPNWRALPPSTRVKFRLRALPMKVSTHLSSRSLLFVGQSSYSRRIGRVGRVHLLSELGPVGALSMWGRRAIAGAPYI